jgi:hypothetical protein
MLAAAVAYRLHALLALSQAGHALADPQLTRTAEAAIASLASRTTRH